MNILQIAFQTFTTYMTFPLPARPAADFSALLTLRRARARGREEIEGWLA